MATALAAMGGRLAPLIAGALERYGTGCSAVFVSGGGNDFAGFADLHYELEDLLVAGDFSLLGATPVDRVASWNGATWSDLGAGLGHAVDTAARSVKVDQDLRAGFVPLQLAQPTH